MGHNTITGLELRCPSHIKFGELPEPAVIEVKCKSRACGAAPGVVVLHRFDAWTGDLLGTRVVLD